MEFLAIVVLGFSAVLSFSTKGHKLKPKTTRRSKDDADVAFTEAYNFDESLKDKI